MQSTESILIIHNGHKVIEQNIKRLSALNCNCFSILESNEVERIIWKYKPEIVFLDFILMNEKIIDLIRRMTSFFEEIVIVGFIDKNAVEYVADAAQNGVFDFIKKPYSIEQLEITIHNAIKRFKEEIECKELKQPLHAQSSIKEIICNTKIMKQILYNILKISKYDSNVLIWGESGTGKELIAHLIHEHSLRADKPFVALDCVAFPENLLESELFGFEKGSFTGAVKSKPGLLEQANTGTLFLDEIIEIGINLQAKLLRVLQERQFRRIGGLELKSLDIRIVSATNHDPREALKQMIFRKDLYYRLNVIPIHLPPLRDRKDDIKLLAQYFLNYFSQQKNYPDVKISPEALNLLVAYSWPGNIRELQNLIERTISLVDRDIIYPGDLPNYIPKHNTQDHTFSNKPYLEARSDVLENFERTYFKELLTENRDNILKAAKIAGVSRKTIYRMIQKYNL